MFSQKFIFVALMSIILFTACTPQVAATQPPIQPITLRLAVADAEGRPSDPYVREFIEQVKALSNGSIIVEPIWDAGAQTDVGFEQGTIQLVSQGKADVGLAASRAFDTESIKSFQALQAPFLVTNDALAIAVATSDASTKMLENLSSNGIAGLTMWPEDLRHPFSVILGGKILSPEDFAGLTVRATPSDLTYKLLEEFDASPMMGDSDYQAAESGLRQGFSLTGLPVATGNVVFFSKFQVLFANGNVFEKLSEAQQSILRQAAIATQKKAIDEHPSEVEAATAWCSDGGSIVLASAEQVMAFEAAAQPVFATLEKDPLNAELIAAIRELKAKTTPSPGAAACGSTVQTGSGPTAEALVWSGELPPNGTWTVELSVEDLVGMGVPQSDTADWAGVGTFTFQDGKAVYRHQGEADYECEGTYEAVEDFVRITYSNDQGACSGVVEELQWRLDEAGLHFQLIAAQNVPFIEDKAAYEAKPWQKIADQ